MFVIEAKFSFVTIYFKLKMSVSLAFWQAERSRVGASAWGHVRKNYAKGSSNHLHLELSLSSMCEHKWAQELAWTEWDCPGHDSESGPEKNFKMAKWLWTGSDARRWGRNIALEHHSGGKECIWNTAPLGPPLVLPCSVIKVNGKLQQPNSGSTTNGPDPLWMKFWVTPPG